MVLLLLFSFCILSNAYPQVNWDQLRKDISNFTFGSAIPPIVPYQKHQGSFLVRLAWHCTGTYRSRDGRGGCDGAPLTHSPVREWRDNAGLPGLLEALKPVKAKWPQLSWGDFIVFAGTYAVELMEGPTVAFCGGRQSVTDAEASKRAEWFDRGTFRGPGQHLHDLIYVDPGTDNSSEVRRTFAEMGFNDQQTVSIIGGGHAFGGCHASRSGFSGFWTPTPTKWSNTYFHKLVAQYEQQIYKWDNTSDPAHPQFVDKNFHPPNVKLMMLHTDVALTQDASFYNFVQLYANSYDTLTKDFSASWAQLMNRDLGDKPCLGPDYPPVTPLPLPSFDHDAVKRDLLEMLENNKQKASSIARLGWGCAKTYRWTDYRGGCNGFKTRKLPESMWASNQGWIPAFELLRPIKDKYGEDLTYADLVVLASNAAIKSLGGPDMPFCHGRVDYSDGSKSAYLQDGPLAYDLVDGTHINGTYDYYWKMNLTDREMAALLAGSAAMKFDTVDFESVTANDGAFGATITAGSDLDILNKINSTFGDYVKEFQSDFEVFKSTFGRAWTKLINQDRYHQICDPYVGEYIRTGKQTNTPEGPSQSEKTYKLALILVSCSLGFLVLVLSFTLCCCCYKKKDGRSDSQTGAYETLH